MTALRDGKRAWKAAHDRKILARTGNLHLSHGECLDVWFNGPVFHADVDKRLIYDGFARHPLTLRLFQASIQNLFHELPIIAGNLYAFSSYMAAHDGREPQVVAEQLADGTSATRDLVSGAVSLPPPEGGARSG